MPIHAQIVAVAHTKMHTRCRKSASVRARARSYTHAASVCISMILSAVASFFFFFESIFCVHYFSILSIAALRFSFLLTLNLRYIFFLSLRSAYVIAFLRCIFLLHLRLSLYVGNLFCCISHGAWINYNVAKSYYKHFRVRVRARSHTIFFRCRIYCGRC